MFSKGNNIQADPTSQYARLDDDEAPGTHHSSYSVGNRFAQGRPTRRWVLGGAAISELL